jgi:hypothetical protein
MNESYNSLEMMMRQQQRDILRDAELRRMARVGANRNVPHRSVIAPMLARVGGFMVAVGQRLETQAARASSAGSSVICRDCPPPVPTP